MHPICIEGLRLSCLLAESDGTRLTAQQVDVAIQVIMELGHMVDSQAMVTAMHRYVRTAAHEHDHDLAVEIARLLATDFPVREVTVVLCRVQAVPDADVQPVSVTRRPADFA
jgi:hypothetical protein